jgi:uncharacterized membrane protein YedE/YeeE
MDFIFPFFTTGLFDNSVNLFLAILIGMAFGMIFVKAGFSTSAHIAPVFYFKNVMVAQVMVSAIVTASTLLLLGVLFGYIDYSKIYIPATYLGPYFVGGLLFGIGMVMSGWCPGTAVSGVATGKIDALIFLLGVMAGMYFYFDIYEYVKDFANSGNLGRYTIAKALGFAEDDVKVSYVVTFVASFGLLAFMLIMNKIAKNKGDE